MTVYEENIRRDHPTLPNFIDVLSKTEYIFFLALDTHVYTYKYTYFSSPSPPFRIRRNFIKSMGKGYCKLFEPSRIESMVSKPTKKDEGKRKKAD